MKNSNNTASLSPKLSFNNFDEMNYKETTLGWAEIARNFQKVNLQE